MQKPFPKIGDEVIAKWPSGQLFAPIDQPFTVKDIYFDGDAVILTNECYSSLYWSACDCVVLNSKPVKPIEEWL